MVALLPPGTARRLLQTLVLSAQKQTLSPCQGDGLIGEFTVLRGDDGTIKIYISNQNGCHYGVSFKGVWQKHVAHKHKPACNSSCEYPAHSLLSSAFSHSPAQ